MTGSTRRDRSLADIRLRTILTSWHQNSRYRSIALTLHRSQSVKLASQTDLNLELKEPRFAELWRWFLIPLIVLTVVDYLTCRFGRE
jgi:hypothetical protein